MTDPAADLILAELRLLRAEVRRLSLYHPAHDRASEARLEAFLHACHDFSGAGAWTCSELLLDARRAGQRDLLAAIDTIVADATDPAKSLGRYLQQHADATVDGYRLHRCRREQGVWLYSVTRE